MTAPTFLIEELRALADAACDGTLGDRDAARLEALLRGSPDAQRFYLAYVRLDGCLRWEFGYQVQDQTLPETIVSGLVGAEVQQSVGPAVELPHRPEPRTPNPESPVQPIIIDLTAPLPSPLSPLHSFVGLPVFSYMVATVVLGMMLLGAWAYKINHFQQIVDKQSPSIAHPEMQFVGQITGMKDCRWFDPNTGTIAGASVPLGRKYAMSSGLMEITYDSGAKVILEGPCTYKVESRAGGFLSLGKLTARIGERGERRGESIKVASGQWSVARAKSQTANQKSEIRNQKSNPQSPIPNPFVVRTPTAIVTDLGTEFGVEVSEKGDTTSHVFRGSVRVQMVGNGPQRDVVLRANESARVKKDINADEARLVTGAEVGATPKFVRGLYEPPKLLDLLDVVAGGNGTGNRRERGIDQASGKQDTWYVDHIRFDDHEYHPVTWSKFIDGVFVPYVPSYRSRTVQLDSAGNVFNGFTDRRIIDGVLKHDVVNGKTTGSIWARAADVRSSAEGWRREGLVYALNNNETFMPERRGLMLLHSNAGITFDLAAARETFKDVYPARFRAVAGIGDGPRMHPHAFGMADVWIFVDGRLKWKRLDLCAKDGAVPVDVPLGPEDRFMTIVSTNGRYGQGYDWVVFGDPVLEMDQTEDNRFK